MKITVIGTGYVGLVTGTCFSERGNIVVCVDVDQNKIDQLSKGDIPIYEPGLKDLVIKNIAAKRLEFTTNLNEALRQCEVIFLALPTPPGEDGSADLSYILRSVSDIAPLLKEYVVIVDKSTVPIGTADKVKNVMLEHTDVLFDVVSNPEFLKEGYAVDDFMNPERVVVGTSTKKAKDVMSELYAPFIKEDDQLIHMDIKSAEMTKYAANSFLATKISFMNEIANLCEKLGADVDAVRRGIGSDSRIGDKFLFAGIGYGGSCFPKDAKALQKIASDENYELEIIRATESVNNKQKTVMVNKMLNFYKDLSGKHIALWGLAFKANTDDIREAPSLEIIDELLSRGVTISAYDPEAMRNVSEYFNSRKGLNLVEDKYSALKGAECLIIATEWNEFINADMDRTLSALRSPVIFDGRNLFNPIVMKKSGAIYHSVGRQSIDGTKGE